MEKRKIKLSGLKILADKLPKNWEWEKCYELSYLNYDGSMIEKTHWALKSPDNDSTVCSLGLISHDNFTETKGAFLKNDLGAAWVEQSIESLHFLLQIADRYLELLKNSGTEITEIEN